MNDTYNGSSIITGALYIDVPSKIFDIIEGKYETYILDARREKSYDITDEKLFGILESNEIHKYIIDFIEDGKNINSRVIDAISATNTLLFDEQAKQQLPLSEKLLGASVLGITASEPDEVIVSIKITNQAGVTATASVNL
jgi:hypothetical protein